MATTYGDLDPREVKRDLVTDAVFAELRLFLEEWLSFRPHEYQEEDLYAAAAVMVERLGLSVTLRIAQAYALDLVFGDGSQAAAAESPAAVRERALELVDGHQAAGAPARKGRR